MRMNFSLSKTMYTIQIPLSSADINTGPAEVSLLRVNGVSYFFLFVKWTLKFSVSRFCIPMKTSKGFIFNLGHLTTHFHTEKKQLNWRQWESKLKTDIIR